MTNPSPASDDTPKSKLPVIVVATALTAWMLTLMGFSQVPRLIVVNQTQVRRAERMITGLVTNVESGEVEVKKLWFGKEPESNSMAVPNLDQVEGVEVQQGKTYLMPMWNDGRIVKVRKRSELKDNRPAIYADTEEMRSQVQAAIDRGLIRD